MLEVGIGWLLRSLGLNPGTRLFETIAFFLDDTIKIFFLLFVMISAIGFLRTYIPQEKIRRWLSGKRRGAGNLVASLFGAITPFCSCSSIPIFLGFLKAGVPLGVTFSFLITSPIVNEYLVVLMFALFGWKITLAYVLSGIIIGTLSGMLLGRMKLEKHLVTDLMASKTSVEKGYASVKERLRFGVDEALGITRKIWLWLIAGVAIGAIIHNYVPAALIQGMIEKGGIFSVPLATLLGVPLYGSCAAILPIALVLFQKGVPLGTALAFMMGISALSFPEAVMLRRAMKLKLILIFFAITTLAIILTGYLLNALQPLLT